MRFHTRRHRLDQIARLLLLGLGLAGVPTAQGLPPVPVPAGNPITPDKVHLGRALFWDEQLSSTGTVACGTCHAPKNGGSDPRSARRLPAAKHPGADGIFGTSDDGFGSPGVVRHLVDGRYEHDDTFGLSAQVTGRKAPSVINAAFLGELLWDGSAGAEFVDPVGGAVVLSASAALESQAVGPPLDTAEMAHVGRDWPATLARLRAVRPLALAQDVPASLATWIGGRDYAQLFEVAFASPGMSAARLAMAIASYERTLVSDQSPFDALQGGNLGALTPEEQRGLVVFGGTGRCFLCHTGSLLSDELYHNVGLRPAAEDLGRALVTGLSGDDGRFKTPPLRNVELRAPYFHNGSARSLQAVISFYNRGGDVATNRDPLIQPLGLTPGARSDLLAFLKALTDPRVATESAPFDRPTLYTESNRVPSPLGFATPGSAGFEPRMIALEPFQIGNPSATLAIEDGLGGALALLAFDVASNPAGGMLFGATTFLALTPLLAPLHMAPLAGVGAGAGWSSFSFALPNDTSLTGITVFAQWIIADPGSLGGLSASAAVTLPVF